MTEVSRRTLLRGIGLSSLGIVATTRGSRTAMAASDWENTSLTYESSDGIIPSLTLNGSDISFSFSWSNFPNDGGSIGVMLSARLSEAENAYEQVFTDSFSVDKESGTTTVSGTDDFDGSLPVGVLETTSITSADFSPADGETEKTTSVDFQAKFEYGDETIVRETTCAVTVRETTPDTVVYDFESGDLSNWDIVNTLTADSSRQYAGSYAGYADPEPNSGEPVAETVIDGYEGGVQPSSFEYFWQETTYSGGCGLQLLNSNGEVELGLATNNPEWVILDGNGKTSPGDSDGYDRWIQYSVDAFDWTNGTFDVTYTDLQSGSSWTDSGRPLRVGRDIETVQLHTYGNGGFADGSSIDSWFDDITFTK